MVAPVIDGAVFRGGDEEFDREPLAELERVSPPVAVAALLSQHAPFTLIAPTKHDLESGPSGNSSITAAANGSVYRNARLPASMSTCLMALSSVTSAFAIARLRQTAKDYLHHHQRRSGLQVDLVRLVAVATSLCLLPLTEADVCPLGDLPVVLPSSLRLHRGFLGLTSR